MYGTVTSYIIGRAAPAGNDVPTVVYGVNDYILKPDDRIISAASCSTNALAPMQKALNDFAPIQSGNQLTDKLIVVFFM